MTILCGTCAWADHHGFYPRGLKPRDKLRFYAAYFPLVEVDSTYYGIPSPSAVEEWVAETPGQFSFDVKVYKSLTRHVRDADRSDILQDVRRMHDALEPLRQSGKLGLILFQFPPWFVMNAQHQTYLREVRSWYPDDRIAVEFRHRSWWLDDEAIQTSLQLLRDNRFVNVVCDEPQSGMGTIPLVDAVTNTTAVMFRLHGRNAEKWYEKGLVSSQQRFDYRYSLEELTELSLYVRRWSEEAQSVHVLMNNNQADYAVTNAFDWQAILGLESKPRPPKPSVQSTLFDAEVE